MRNSNLRKAELHTFRSGYVGNVATQNEDKVQPLLPAGFEDKSKAVQQSANGNNIAPMLPAGIHPKTFCEDCE